MSSYYNTNMEATRDLTQAEQQRGGWFGAIDKFERFLLEEPTIIIFKRPLRPQPKIKVKTFHNPSHQHPPPTVRRRRI